jgi:hypothetical protein
MFPWPRLEPWIVNDFESSADLYEALMSSACVRVNGLHCVLCGLAHTNEWDNISAAAPDGMLFFSCTVATESATSCSQLMGPPCGVGAVRCFVRCLPYVLNDAMFRQFRGHRVIDGAFTENTPMHEDDNK